MVTPGFGRLLSILAGGAVFSAVTRFAAVFGRDRGAGRRVWAPSHGNSLVEARIPLLGHFWTSSFDEPSIRSNPNACSAGNRRLGRLPCRGAGRGQPDQTGTNRGPCGPRAGRRGVFHPDG